jgi:hypothetical protein
MGEVRLTMLMKSPFETPRKVSAMTTAEIETALADAIAREYVARQTGAAELQRIAMDEVRALRAADRQRRCRCYSVRG